MGGGRLLAVDDPFVHAPEVAGADVEAECVDDAGDQWQLLGGSNGSADTDGVVVGALFPGGDVFEGFGQIEIFEGVVEVDFETGAREALHFLRGEGRGVGHQFRVKRGIIPPIRGNARNRTGRGGAGTHRFKPSRLDYSRQSQLPWGRPWGRSHLFTQKGPHHTKLAFSYWLRGTGPALAGRLWERSRFRATREGWGDRLQCSLRPGPAAAWCLVSGVW